MGDFTGLLRQGFIVISAGSKRVEGQIKLVFPAKFEAGFSTWRYREFARPMPFRQVGGVSGNLIGDKPLFNIFFIGGAQNALSALRSRALHNQTSQSSPRQSLT